MRKGKAVIEAAKTLEDEPPLDVMAPQKDTREAGVDGWKFKVDYLLIIIASTLTYCSFRLVIRSCFLRMQIYPRTTHGLNYLRLRTTHEASIIQVPDCQNTNIGLEIRVRYLLHLVQPVVASMLQSQERRVRFHSFISFFAPMLTDSQIILDHLRSETLDSFQIFLLLHQLNWAPLH